MRETGAEALRSAGFHVLTAANGQEALSVFLSRGSEIRGVVLDVIMPEMGGVRAAGVCERCVPHAHRIDVRVRQERRSGIGLR